MSDPATAPARRRFPVVADVFDSRSNAIGLLRLLMALLVVLDHGWAVGRGAESPLRAVTHHQTDTGRLAVAGFFVLSGLLVTRSARRSSPGRFFWHRGLRIFPGFWVCLLLMVLVMGPLLWLAQEGSLAGYLTAHPSPVQFLTGDFFTAMRHYGIGDLLEDTPYGRVTGESVFNGSLWTLRYELLCYLGAAVFTVWGLSRRRPALVLLPAVLLVYGAAAVDLVAGGDRFNQDPSALPLLPPLPLLGGFVARDLVTFAMVFLLGAAAATLPGRFPVSGRLALVALVVAVATTQFGAWDLIGLPAFAYLVLWAAMRLPAATHRIGTRTDLSYGIYIYGFPIQQLLAVAGLQRLGLPVFVLVSMLLASAAGWLSWHLVERPALRLKNAAPPWARRRAQGLTPGPESPDRTEPGSPPCPSGPGREQPVSARPASSDS